MKDDKFKGDKFKDDEKDKIKSGFRKERHDGSEFSIDEILAEVHASKKARIADDEPEGEVHMSRSMEEIDRLLEPRKGIKVDDIITPDLLEKAGKTVTEGEKETYNELQPEKEEKTRVLNKLDEREHKGSFFKSSKAIVGSKIETNEDRRRFINPPVQKIERTADFQRKFESRKPGMIERPGIVTKRGSMSATADLDPLPTIVSAEDADDNEKTKRSGFIPKAKEKAPVHNEIEGQMHFKAFENADDDWVEKIDEEEAEAALKRKRKEKINSFKIFGIEDLENIAEEEEIEEIEDTEDENEKHIPKEKKVSKKSSKEKSEHSENNKDEYDGTELRKASDTPYVAAALRKEMLHYVGAMVLCLFFVIMYLIFSLTGSSNGPARVQMLTTFNLVVVCAAVICGGVSAVKGAENLIKGKPNADTSVTVSLLAASVQAVWAFGMKFSGTDSMVPLYGCLAALFVVFNLGGHYLVSSRAYKNLRFIAPLRKKYSVQEISDKDTAFEIGRGLLLGDPDIRCSVPVKFPTKFIENTYAADPANKYSKVMMPLFFGLSLICGVVYGAVKGDYFGGVSLFTAAACVSMPFCALIASNLPLGKADSKLIGAGAMISGHKAVGECGDVNAVVLDSSDIFSEGGCEIYGIKTYHGMRIDEAILDTAAVVIKAGGASSGVFDQVILGKRDILPPVENLAYEDKLGLSAWIHGRRILVGNRDLLINHNVEAPSRESELKYRHDNRQIMYLAVSGKIAAMFVVGFKANPGIKSSLRMMESKGISVLVRTSDANITEELISNFFGINKNAVKVISAVAGEMYRKEHIRIHEAEAKIIHNGSVKSMLAAVNAAAGLYYGNGMISAVQTVLSAFGIGITVILAFVSGFAQLQVHTLLIYQFACAAVIYCIAAFRKKL